MERNIELLAAQQPCREEEDFEPFDLTRGRTQPGYDLVS